MHQKTALEIIWFSWCKSYVRLSPQEISMIGNRGAAMPGLKERAKTLVELADATYYLTASRPLALDDKAQKLVTPEARAILAEIAAVLSAAPDWSAPALETAVKALAEAMGWKLGNAAQSLRAALTGRTTSTGFFDVLAVLGRAESLARIGDLT
jgi:glutamyl-tRNA synthetase